VTANNVNPIAHRVNSGGKAYREDVGRSFRLATTRLIPLHAGKELTITAALGRSTDYVKNPEKTDGGKRVSTYESDPVSVDLEFRFFKAQYATIMGRDQRERDVII